MASPAQEARRQDARRNRQVILAAARELFAESADVPMCEVARRAGVGQATLYRNFPERSALAAELLAEQIERTDELARQHDGDPDAFFVLLRHVAEEIARFHTISELARQGCGECRAMQERRRRLAESFRIPLQQAKAAGTLRRELTVEDVFLVMRMVRGAVEEADGAAARAAAASRALGVVLDGLRVR